MIVTCKLVLGARNIRGHHLRFRNLKAPIRKENGKAVFPQDIEGNLDIDGLPRRDIKAKLLQGVRSPLFLQSDGKSKKQLSPEEKVLFLVSRFLPI